MPFGASGRRWMPRFLITAKTASIGEDIVNPVGAARMEAMRANQSCVQPSLTGGLHNVTPSYTAIRREIPVVSSKIRNFSIKTKIAIAFGIMVALVAGLGVTRGPAVGVVDHQVAVDRDRRDLDQGLDDGQAEREVRDEVVVHDVEMDDVRAGFEHGEIGRAHV